VNVAGYHGAVSQCAARKAPGNRARIFFTATQSGPTDVLARAAKWQSHGLPRFSNKEGPQQAVRRLFLRPRYQPAGGRSANIKAANRIKANCSSRQRSN